MYWIFFANLLEINGRPKKKNALIHQDGWTKYSFFKFFLYLLVATRPY